MELAGGTASVGNPSSLCRHVDRGSDAGVSTPGLLSRHPQPLELSPSNGQGPPTPSWWVSSFTLPTDTPPAQKCPQEAVFKGRFPLDKPRSGNIICTHDEFWHNSRNFSTAVKVGC